MEPQPSGSKKVNNTPRKSTEKVERYAPQFKQKVLDFLLQEEVASNFEGTEISKPRRPSYISTANKFNIHYTTISDWVQELNVKSEIKQLLDGKTSKAEKVKECDVEEALKEVMKNIRQKLFQDSPEFQMVQKTLHEDLVKIFSKQDFSSEERGVVVWWQLWWRKLQRDHDLSRDEINPTNDLLDDNSTRIMYPQWFKIEVAEYAIVLGQRAVGRMMSISQRRVFEWVNAFKKSSKLSNNTESEDSAHLSARCTTQLTDYDVEKDIFNWVLEQLPVRVSSTAVREKAAQLYKEKGHESIKCSYGWYRRFVKRFQVPSGRHQEADNIVLSWILEQYDQNQTLSYSEVQKYAEKQLTKIKPNFQSSMGWVERFFKRNIFLLNWDDIYDGALPVELEKAIEVFLKELHISVLPKYSPELIGCMDEIPISFFDFYSRSQNEVPPPPLAKAKKYGIANCDATVMLTLLSNGVLLPPLVIIKGSNVCDLNRMYSQKESSVVVYYSESTESTLNCLEKWHESIWTNNFKNREEHMLLLVDDYNLHHKFKEKYNSDSFRIEIFPPGCSCKLQPLNFSVRRKFLKFMENFCMDHLKENGNETERFPSKDEIIQWVTKSYEKLLLEKDILGQAFAKTRLVAI